MRTCPVGQQGSLYDELHVYAHRPCRNKIGLECLMLAPAWLKVVTGEWSATETQSLPPMPRGCIPISAKSHPDDSKSYMARESNGQKSLHMANGEGICPQLARRCGSRGRGKRGTATRAEILPDMGVPSPRYQITGEGWRRLSCQPCRGHESPVESLLVGSGSCQEPVRKDIKDHPNRHSQSR